MNELVRCRAMESLCRQRATFYPEESWKWLAEAEMWDHKAFECSNRPEESKAAPSKSSSVGDEGSFGGRLSSSRNVPEVIGGVYVSNYRREVLATAYPSRPPSTLATY